RDVYDLVVEAPDVILSVPAVAASKNFDVTLNKLACFFICASKDQRLLMLRQRQASNQVRLTAARLSAVEQLIGLAVEGLRLRTRIRLPLPQPLLDGRDRCKAFSFV